MGLFGFTGRPQAGSLYYVRARFYDPYRRQVYLLKTQLEIAGGPNVYGYVENNPVSFTDSNGKFINLLLGGLLGGGIDLGMQLLMNHGNWSWSVGVRWACRLPLEHLRPG